MYLNEATLLNNVRVRYNKDHIYVSKGGLKCYLSPLRCFLYVSYVPSVEFPHQPIEQQVGGQTGRGIPTLVSLWGEKLQVVKREGSNCQTSKPNPDPSHSIRK